MPRALALAASDALACVWSHEARNGCMAPRMRPLRLVGRWRLGCVAWEQEWYLWIRRSMFHVKHAIKVEMRFDLE